MTKKQRWFWALLFVVLVLLLGTLATSWNIVLVQDHDKPWTGVILGSLGFAVALGATVLFFLRLLKEMKLNQLQSEFVSAVSHELKTPIATMELSTSLLKADDVSPEERARLWAAHDAELRRLKDSVSALLEAARLQADPSRPSLRPVILESWLDESLARWRTILGKDATLTRTGEPLSCRAEVDPRMLDMITDNLVDNARKFSREKPRVVIHSELLAPGSRGSVARWQIHVRDEGWGFQPSESRLIFRRFFRAKVPSSYAIPGTGLGLHLAQAASRAMGLELSGQSSGIGRGAVFTIEGETML